MTTASAKTISCIKLMQHFIPFQEAWYQVGMDLVGPLPVTPAGNKFLMTITDYYTKWAVAAALKDKTALSVANVLYLV